MKKLLSMIVLFALQTAFACVVAQDVVPVIPRPVGMERAEGSFDLTKLKAIYYGDAAEWYCQEFADQLQRTLGIDVKVAASGDEAPAIRFCTLEQQDKEMTEQESSTYKLKVSENAIEIWAEKDAGFFYGLQTLKQLMPRQFFAKQGTEVPQWACDALTVPCLTIDDKPRFAHRGYMLDVARHFFTKDEVKHVLDLMALYKLNVFHWHLTDDQGWRIEIPEYPRLTEVGAVRTKSLTNAGLSTNFYDDTEYGRGCYFTLDDLREIVDYAAKRNITIIPEVDLPGHMVAALASYPELSCNPSKTYSVRIDSGIAKDVLDISNPKVLTFLKCVLGHVAEVFPGKLIHIGGDECPTDNWTASKNCQAFAKEKGLTIAQLQGWLVEELGEWLRDEYGKDIVVWDELLDSWPKTNQIKPVIMAWHGTDKTATAASRGMSSIVVPYQYLYLDFMQQPENKCDVNEGYQGGWGPSWVNALDKIYGLNPTVSLSGKESYALGPQGNMWTETCSSISQVEYQMLPRLLALAEIAWTPNNKKNWNDFLSRLQSHDEIFDALGVSYAKHFIDASATPADKAALRDAKAILDATLPGCAGYATLQAYDALTKAYDALAEAVAAGKDTQTLTAALKAEIEAFKKSDIVMPDESKVYQIVSASTYYKAAYAGSTIYLNDKVLQFHYTPQLEPEELWTVEPQDDGTFKIVSFLSFKRVSMPGKGISVKAGTTGTPLVFKKATQANGKYDYVPGSVLIQKASAVTNMLYADVSAVVMNTNDQKVCGQGTWRLQEVTDFKLMLDKLVAKARLLILRGGLTDEQIEYLTTELIEPAEAETDVDREKYSDYVNIYAQYLGIDRKTLVGIESVTEAKAANVWYDLQGRRVDDNARGLLINAAGQKIVR